MKSNELMLSAVLVLAPVTCVAGGTVGLNEIEPLLREKPAIRAFLLSSLNLDDTVMAAARFGPHFEHLGGARMGPYMLQGRPKGPKEGTPLEIVLCTDARFLDESGHAVEDETSAARVEEHLTAVMLREVGSVPATPSCPEK